ncbi:L-serine ammonia-lyase [Hippea jasoniae]|uniref:L-serine ammonia-lyase n=1 Tax=Hippea jasoniae TaxID=944479 RepID=UPI00055810F1|nr:L-serine ammonia-lyase [Hippea jasoniae]
MESIRELFKYGHGPSSSHTMGPQRAAEEFKKRYPQANYFKVILYGSLAATGKGHLTDVIIAKTLKPAKADIIFKPEIFLEKHPNGMDFEAYVDGKKIGETWRVYSVGGGTIKDFTEKDDAKERVYDLNKLTDILKWCKTEGKELWEYVEKCEGDGIWDFLADIWEKMKDTIERGLVAEGVLPGSLKLPRKASSFYLKSKQLNDDLADKCLLSAYALATSEENAAGGKVVTAPTCGSSGVLPAVLRFMQEKYQLPDEYILKALAIAGLIGNLIKHNASIAGAEVGCQGEVGAACSMAAAAAAKLRGASPQKIEYAAEIAMEHHLGLTCDPVGGYVQIPCIERNVVAASRAIDSANYAFFSDGTHRISFDKVVDAMMKTGKDLKTAYKETSKGGLAVEIK